MMLHSALTQPDHPRLNQICEVITQAAQAGGARAAEMQVNGFERFFKTGLTERNELLTSADLESQGIIIARLKDRYPEIPILAEEQDQHKIEHEAFFTIDPIDGTLCFADGDVGWGCTVGYIRSGYPKAGTLVAPRQHGLAWGWEQGGSFVNGRRVLFEDDGPKTVVAPVGPWTPPFVTDVALPRIEEQGYQIIRVRSVVDGIFQILLGNAAVYVGGAEKIWDIGGGGLLVSEAGGFSCNFKGEPVAWDQVLMPTLFARSQRRMDEIIPLVQQAAA